MVGVRISSLTRVIRTLIVFGFFVYAPLSFAQLEPKNTDDAHSQSNATTREFSFVMPPEFQTELPQDEVRIGEKIKPKNRRRSSGKMGAIGPVFQMLFYGILALAVLYILYLIFNSMAAIKRSKVKADRTEELPDIPDYTPDAETAKVVLDDAEKLASMGKFAEAVHVILFRSIADIDKKRPHYVKRSFTSREIAGLSILSPSSREVFSQIAKLVESSFFGGHMLGEAEYLSSVSAYQTLVTENRPQSNSTRKPRGRR